MKIMKLNIIILLLVAFSLVSCDEAFLDRYPKDQLSENNFWIQESDAEMFVNDMYGVFPDQIMDKATDSDNAVHNVTWYEGDVSRGVYDPLNGAFSGEWSWDYNRIRKTNIFFENIDNIPDLDTEARKRLVGQAHFFRAYAYWDLLKVFASEELNLGVPLITKSLVISETYDVKRDSYDDCLTFMFDEYQNAVDNLPVEESEYGEDSHGRLTKGAALAMKARAALFFNRFDIAEAAAKEVINLNKYKLYDEDFDGDGLYPHDGDGDDYHALFYIVPIGDPRKKEMILERQRVKDTYPYTWNTFQAPPPKGEGGVAPTQSFVDAFETINGLTINEDPSYDSAHPFNNRDPRLEVCVLHDGEDWINVGDTVHVKTIPGVPPMGIGTDPGSTRTGYYNQKFLDPKDDMGGIDYHNTGFDWPIMRYAEVLLIYAEARVQQGKIDGETYDAINQVRNRVGMPDVDESVYNNKDKLIELLIRENRVEFGMEGKRWLDVRHYGKQYAFDHLNGQFYGMKYDPETQTPFVGDPIPAGVPREYQLHNILWPIPQDEINLNSNLVQNPGY